MALPDYGKIGPGTAVIWGVAAASGVTLTLNCEGLANNTARMGAVADLGALWDEEQLIYLIEEVGTAITAGLTVELYMACTDDTARYPGTVNGADGAYPAIGNRFQLGPPVAVLYGLATANTVNRQNPVIWRPSGRYVVPVFANFTGQAIRDEVTATDNDTRVIMVPRKLSLED